MANSTSQAVDVSAPVEARVALPVIQGNERPEICGPCGGRCCKHAPGYPWPEDFGASSQEIEQNVAAALRTGKWTIDDNDEPGSDFIRPAVRGCEGLLYHQLPREAGICSHLEPSGCGLSFEKRPRMCRLLEALASGGCQLPSGIDNFAAIRAWAPYQSELRRALSAVEAES